MERGAFFDRLRQSRLLSEAELARAASRFGEGAATENIADALVREGVLTSFQASQVCSGDTQPLTLGPYRLLDELGRGGMGRVYKALHTVMGRVVAVKVIATDLVRDPVAIEWFRREVRASTQLLHPNIVMAFDANEVDGLHFLVMEYVQGQTLDALVRQRGPLPIDCACAVMRQVALGLQHAHDRGMVHRDIKPHNLLIPVSDGEQIPDVLVKIADFGLVRLQGKSRGDTIALRGEAEVLGTPDYIAPEQSRDIHAADIRSDLYSLGCVFYFVLAGRVPFPGENAMEKLIKHLMEDPEPLEQVRPDVPLEVAAIVRRLMSKNPDARFQTPAELAQALEPWTAEPSKVPPMDSPPRPALDPFSDGPMATRMLARIEVFAPSQQQEKCDSGEVPPRQTPDTLVLSPGEDTEEVTAETMTLEQHSRALIEELNKQTFVDSELRRLWSRWTWLVESIAAGRGPSRTGAEDYRRIHTSLLQACREALEWGNPNAAGALHREMLSIAQPWLHLQSLLHTERDMLASLLRRCKRIEWKLNGGRRPWTLRQGIALALLMLTPISAALGYGHFRRSWTFSLLRFSWSDTPMRSPWAASAALVLLIVSALYVFSRRSRL